MGNKNLKSYVSGPVSKASLALIFAAAVGMSVFADWYAPGRAEAAPTANGMVVYSNNSTTPQYRSYTAASNTFDAATATLANAAQTFVVTKSATTRNEKMVGYVTTGGVLYVMRWNGSAWSNEWNVTVGGNGVDGRRFDITYENTSGNAMVAYSTNATGTAGNEIAYRIWDGSTWTAATNINSARFSQNATVTWIKLKSRPTAGSNEIAMTAADIGTTAGDNSILTSFIWNGSTWTEPGAAHANNLPNTTTPLFQNDLFDMAYESTSGDLLVVFTASNNQQYYRTYSGGTWGGVTSYGTGKSAPLQMIAASNPNTNQILVAWNESGKADIFGNIWSGAGISATTTVGTNGANPSIEKKGITGQWLNVGGTDYAVVVWNTSTAGTLGRNYYTGGAWGAEGTYNTGTGVTANWMDSDVDPQGSDTMMLTFSTGAAGSGRVWVKRLVLSAGPTFTWTNADGGTALTTTLASATTQNFDFAYNIITTMTTVGDGTNPANATIGPGGATTDLDAFTLQINTGTDTITALTVTLGPANAYQNIDSVAITSDDGLTTYGTATGLASNTVNITLTPNITVTTTSTQYRVKITPKSHANMPAVPGASYDTTGTVTAVTSTFPPSYNDTASATITVDNGSPADATWGTITPADTQITLNWTNPGDADFSQVVILKKTSAIADAPTEGATYIAGNTIGTSTVVYAGSLQTYADTSVTNGTSYYYKIFSKDTRGNYAAGVQTGPHIPNNQPPSITSGPNQYKTDAATVITQGGYTSEAAARFKATATDVDGNTYKLDVEVVTTASAFTNTATCSSALVASGTEASTANCGAFVNGTGYKWQYRVVDSLNNASAWTAFGASDPDLTRDTIAPLVDTTIPANGATGVTSPTVTINWQAGENMDCSTVTTTTVTISPAPTSWTKTSCSGNQAVFTASGQASSTIYTVTVVSGASGVKDLAGNQQAANYVFSYTTGNTPPSAVSNLSVVAPIYTRGFRLTWTAPSSTIGAVASYDFRYKDAADYPATMSTTYLDTNWASLTQAQNEPTPAASGTTEYFNMTTDTASNKMTPNTLYYIAMKSKNDAGTDSSISNIVSDHTAMKYGYNFMGLPYNPAATSTFNALFSDDMYPTTNPVYVMKWDSSSLTDGQWTYVDPATVPERGVGYWVYAYCMNCSVLDDQLGDGANGASVIVPLEQGWNDIANPYLKNVLVSNTYLCKSVGGIVTGFTAPNCTGTGTITTNTFANAVTASWTLNAVYYHANSSTWGYETYDGSGGQPVANLRPWWGQRIYGLAADAPVYTQGIGTVSTSGTTVTGVGTSFTTALAVGNMINVGGQVRVITAIGSDTSLTVGNAFSPNLPAGTLYSYSADTTSYFIVITQP